MAETVLEQFRKKYESLAGHVHLVADAAAAAEVVMGVVAQKKGDRLAIGELREDLAREIERRCAEGSVELLKPPFDNMALPDSIDAAQVGVTRAAFGVAEAGAVVEFTTNDAIRLVSTLPRTHLAVLYAEDMLATLKEAAPPIRSFYEENPANATVTFISGPSRSGDIEMRLTLGVHGPEEAHTVIVTG